ncbi:MAG: O-antigen ligase family protein [Dysgonamonadaceae bacterium]|jgi:tetratricopeptide (TPR) repeat protein|nr:O-antigen ligase family protein [Dysgonamonadaceae bacterium]
MSYDGKLKMMKMQVKRIGKEIVNGILLIPFGLVLATVFIVDQGLAHGVVSGKYFWFYGAMGITVIAALFSVVWNRQKVSFSILDGLVTLFCLSGLVVSYVYQETWTTKCILLLLLWVFYCCVRIFCSQNKRNLPVLAFFLVITGLIEAIWGLKQLYGFSFSQHALFKTTGSFFNPGPYAGYLAVVFPLALYFWLHGTRSKTKTLNSSFLTLNSITCVAIFLILPAAMSRASWLAAAAGSAIILFTCYGQKIFEKVSRVQRIIIVVSLLLVLITALVGIYLLKKDSADGRALMWKISLRAIPKHPWGVGLGNFSGAYSDEQAIYFASGQASEQEELVAGSPEYGFNEYLQICIEWGVVPFLLFLAIIAGSIYIACKRKLWAWLASLISLLVFAGMSYPFGVLPFAIVLVFLIAAIAVNTDEMKNAGFRLFILKMRLNPRYLCCLCSMLLFVVVFCLYNRYPTYEAYKKWKPLQILYQAKAYESAKKDYDALYPYLNDRIYFLFEYGQVLSHTENYGKSNEILRQASRISCDPMIYNIMGKNYQALKAYRQAEDCFIHATQIVPNRLYPWYLLCKLQAEMGLLDKAAETAEIVLTKEPKVQSTAVREMREEVKKLRTKSYEL